MKNKLKLIGIIAVVAITALAFAGCRDPGTSGGIDPTYGISLSQTATHVFAPAAVGYAEQTALPVTVTNTGNQATGALTATLFGADASSFTLSATSIASIAVGGNASFTVRPNTGLEQGTYTATVAVEGGNGISESFGVSFAVDSANYSISLSQTETHVFHAAVAGYAEPPAALSVTVTNTGNQPTGTLTAALSGADADSFTLSVTSIESIAVGGYADFTVRPNTGLVEATYTATVTVSGDTNITERSFDVFFAVDLATFGISLSQTEPNYYFSAAVAGYAEPPAALPVTITNTGNQPTGALTVALSGHVSDGFTLSATSIESISAGGNAIFTVRPNAGLSAGTYSATVTVSGDTNITERVFYVYFIVDSATFGILLSQTGPHVFAAADAGYAEPPAALSVTVTNTGNVPTGTLFAALSGASPSSFTLSAASIESIAVDGTANFTVRPNMGLPAGTHAANVSVSGTGSIWRSFNVSFTVNYSADITALSIEGVTAINRVYNGTTTVELTGGTLSGVTPGDDVDFILGSGTMANPNAGSWKSVTTNIQLTGADAGKYALWQPSGISVEITPAPLDIDGVTAVNRVYNRTATVELGGGELRGTIFSPDVIGFNLGTGTMANYHVGTGKAVTTDIRLTGTSAGNYMLTQPTGITVDITAAPLTITGVTAVDRVFAAGNLAVNLHGGTLQGLFPLDAGFVNFNLGAGMMADDAIGTGKPVTTNIMLTGMNAGNYYLTAQPADVTVRILEAAAGVGAGAIAYYWVDRHGNLAATDGGAFTVARRGTLVITAMDGGGFTNHQWEVNGVVQTGETGPTFSFSRAVSGTYTVGLFVQKDGKLYNTNLIITVQ